MGTYYMAVNHSKRQKINPHDLNEGAKLGEATKAKDLLWRLLACGVWDASDSIVVISDREDELWSAIDDSYTQMVSEDVE